MVPQPIFLRNCGLWMMEGSAFGCSISEIVSQCMSFRLLFEPRCIDMRLGPLEAKGLVRLVVLHGLFRYACVLVPSLELLCGFF